MRILLVRHADPEYITDSLTRHGRREAAALARYFASDACEARPTRLYSSPRERARATARYTEKALGLTAEVEPWTTELISWPRLSGGDGGMGGARPGEGGLALWDTAGEEVVVRQAAATGSVQRQFGVGGVPALQEVEGSYGELRAFSDMFVARHGYVRETEGDAGAGTGRYRVVSQNRDVVAVFCHGGFGLTWLASLLGLPLMSVFTGFFLPPSSVTTILFDERSPDFATPRLLGVGCTPHLIKEDMSFHSSKYERPNKYKKVPGARKRVSGVKSNFY